MTGTDLIVVAPWIIFAAALTVVCIRLHPQGTPCPKKNAQAPWR